MLNFEFVHITLSQSSSSLSTLSLPQPGVTKHRKDLDSILAFGLDFVMCASVVPDLHLPGRIGALSCDTKMN